MPKLYRTQSLWNRLVKMHRFSSQDVMRIGQEIWLQGADRQRRIWNQKGFIRKLTREECENLGLWKLGRARLAWHEVVVEKGKDQK